MHASGRADNDEPIDTKDLHGSEMGLVIDPVRGSVVLMTADKDDPADVNLDRAEGCRYTDFFQRGQACLKEGCPPNDS